MPSLILAIEPDPRQAAHIRAIVRHRVGAELVLADTTERALDAVGNRVPDLVLVPALLSPQDDAALAQALRVIATAAHVQMLTIPVLAAPQSSTPSRGGVLSALRRERPRDTAIGGCDPAVFAEQIRSYLEQVERERAAQVDDAPDAVEEHAEPPETPPAPMEAEPPASAFAHLLRLFDEPEPPPLPVEPEPVAVLYTEPPVAQEEPPQAAGVLDHLLAELESASLPAIEEVQVESWAQAEDTDADKDAGEAIALDLEGATELAPMLEEAKPAAEAEEPVEDDFKARAAAAAASSPEWVELVASLRQDMERRRVEPAARPARPERRRPAPVQDEWGFFDPEQCGFAALLAKLEEITQ